MSHQYRWLSSLLFLVVCVCTSPVMAQYSSGFETLDSDPAGVIITGQDGFYIPIGTTSVDGLMYDYVGNTLGLPANPGGGDQFVGCTGPGAPGGAATFARAQRDVDFLSGPTWRIGFDCAGTFTGVLPTGQNLGSVSTQSFAAGTNASFIALLRWADVATATEWNADFVWFDAAGTQLTESVADPAFQNLPINTWYRWEIVFDLPTNQILQVELTDVVAGTTVTNNPVGRYMEGGATPVGLLPPTGFRFFAGSGAIDGNSIGFDNMDIAEETLVCLPVTGLSCAVDCGAGEIALDWTNPGATPFTSIEVRRDGASIATLAGTDTSYIDSPGDGEFTYTIEGICAAGPALSTTSCDVALLTGLDTATHLVFAGELPSDVDSVTAITAAITATGATPLVLTSIDPLPCGGLSPETTIFMMLGSWPDNHPLTAGEGQLLVDHIEAGGAVYLEGPDTWGFDPATVFSEYDGIDGGAVDDGDDSFLGMIGSDHADALLSGLDATYTQDQAGIDYTDQLVLSALDLAGPDSGVIWADDTTGGGTGYTTGVFYNTDPGFGKVLCQSWEFGGYNGDQLALYDAYALALGKAIGDDFFSRGDCNNDGGFDIGDPVTALSILFVMGTPPADCQDACDMNNDGGFDIGDPVTALTALFVTGGAPLPSPAFPDCGADVDTGAGDGSLGCDTPAAACP